MRSTSRLIRSTIFKTMGLLVAPLTFSCIICGIILLFLNATIGDVIGYGSLLLMDMPKEEYHVSDFLVPAETGENVSNTVDIRDVTFPTYEQPYGEISIPAVDILCPMIYGDTDRALKMGAGQYIGSSIIGYGGTTMVCAHVNRHFKNLHKVKVGDEIQVRTTYGVYTYTVTDTMIHEKDYESLFDLGTEEESLVLYTCYYEYNSFGSVKKRFFVITEYTSGPMIVDRGE